MVSKAGKAVIATAVVVGGAATLAYFLTRPVSAKSPVAVDFSVALADASGNPLAGQVVTVSIEGVTGASTSVTTGADGTATGAIQSAALIPGKSYTLSASYAGGTISGVTYEASTGSVSFVAGSTASVAVLTRSRGPIALAAYGTLSLSPTSATQGETVKFTVTGGDSGGAVYVKQASPEVIIASGTYDSSGEFSGSFSAPGPAGTYSYTAYSTVGKTADSSNTVTLTVTGAVTETLALSFSPAAPTVGSAVIASVSGGIEGNACDLYTASGTLVASGFFGSGGTASILFNAPDTPGSYSYQAQDAATGVVSNTEGLAVQAESLQLSLSPTNPTEGETVTATVTGGVSDDPCDLYLASGTLVASGYFGSNGVATMTFSAPDTAGTYDYKAYDANTGIFSPEAGITVGVPGIQTTLELTYTGG